MALGILPYKPRITAKSVDGAGTGWLLTVEIRDANGTLKGTKTLNVGQNQSLQSIREAIATTVKLQMEADAGSRSAMLDALVNSDLEWEEGHIATGLIGDATTTAKGVTQLAIDNEATANKPMKSDDPRGSNDRVANNLRTATTVVGISAAAAPSAGQVLTATSGTAANWQSPGAGSDPWTYVSLASDFTTTSASAVDVTGLSFAPAASTHYEFYGILLLRTATATVNPRAGLAWPTGGTDGVADIVEGQTGGRLTVNGNINAALLIAVGGLPNTTQSWPAHVEGMFIAGASPSGSVRLQLASETAGTTVTAKAGSFFRYRTL